MNHAQNTDLRKLLDMVANRINSLDTQLLPRKKFYYEVQIFFFLSLYLKLQFHPR